MTNTNGWENVIVVEVPPIRDMLAMEYAAASVPASVTMICEVRPVSNSKIWHDIDLSAAATMEYFVILSKYFLNPH